MQQLSRVRSSVSSTVSILLRRTLRVLIVHHALLVVYLSLNRPSGSLAFQPLNNDVVGRHRASKTSSSRTAAMKSTGPNDEAIKVRFITNKMCPFAQKAWLALEASNVPYSLEEISLYGAGGKPDWFWKLNPAGTVPVLVLSSSNNNPEKQQPREKVWPDSDLILQAVADGELYGAATGGSGGGGALFSSDDLKQQQRVVVQQWRKAINQMLPIGKQAVLGSRRSTLPKLANILQETMECRLDDKQQFLAGDALTIADCHAFPFLWRLDQEFGLADADLDCPKLARWVEQCEQIPMFRKTIQSSWWWWW